VFARNQRAHPPNDFSFDRIESYRQPWRPLVSSLVSGIAGLNLRQRHAGEAILFQLPIALAGQGRPTRRSSACHRFFVTSACGRPRCRAKPRSTALVSGAGAGAFVGGGAFPLETARFLFRPAKPLVLCHLLGPFSAATRACAAALASRFALPVCGLLGALRRPAPCALPLFASRAFSVLSNARFFGAILSTEAWQARVEAIGIVREESVSVALLVADPAQRGVRNRRGLRPRPG